MAFRMEAHRGISANYPESTFAAFRAAKEEGFDMLEVDPRFTSDGICVIHHDETVNRTARKEDGSEFDKPIPIASLTLEEAKKLDYGIFRGKKFAGERIVTLAELLAFAKAEALSLKFDNRIETFTEEEWQTFIETLKEADMGEKIGFTFTKPETALRLAPLFPECEFHYDGFPEPYLLEEAKKAAEGHRFTVWLCYPSEQTKWYRGPRASLDLCDECKQYGEVGLWLLTDMRQLADALCYFQADIIETDGSILPETVYDL